MKYNQDNINGISFRHKKKPNPIYTIKKRGGEFKIKWNSKGKSHFVAWRTDEIIDYLNEGTWIELLNNQQEVQVSDTTKAE